MTEIKSGIVLYPDGQVLPHIARQLGVVAGDLDSRFPNRTITAHAVAYDSEIVSSAVDLYYQPVTAGDKYAYFSPPPVGDSELELRRTQLVKKAKDYLVDNGFGSVDDELLMYRRRIDLIAPNNVPEDGIAVRSLGHMVNVIRGSSASSFQESAHPWLQKEGRFSTPPNSDSAYDILDYRFDLQPIARTILPTNFATDAIAAEILKVRRGRSIDDSMPKGQQLPVVSIDSQTTKYRIEHRIPVSDEKKAAIELLRQKLNDEDRSNQQHYEHWYGSGDDTSDMFGDYRPEPVSRAELHELAGTVDPLENEAWRNQLS